jgi:hypothetical protein
MPLETTLTAFFRKYFIAICLNIQKGVKVKPIEDFYLVKITIRLFLQKLHSMTNLYFSVNISFFSLDVEKYLVPQFKQV